MPFSIVTLVKGRKKQLENMLESIRYSSVTPDEVVIVWMEPEKPESTVEDSSLPIKQIYLDDGNLPLSKARNLGFYHTTSETVIFLDVDCLCSPTLLENLTTKLNEGIITSAPARYLPFIPLTGDYTEVEQDACVHPKRTSLPTETLLPYKKFWSLVFALTKNTFDKIGGFDENFTGYGGEDTDFAERFNNKGYGFMFVGDEVLHQYHHKYTPPLNYLREIVENANYFYSKHRYFPMYTWLQTFCKMGYITLDKQRHIFRIMSLPKQKDMDSTLSTLPY